MTVHAGPESPAEGTEVGPGAGAAIYARTVVAMSTPDGWQVELVRYAGAPVYRVTCEGPGAPPPRTGGGLRLSIEDLVSLLGDSFELLAAHDPARSQKRSA